MERRNIAGALFGFASGLAISEEKAYAQSCSTAPSMGPLYPLATGETSSIVTNYCYPPYNVCRYGADATGTQDSGPAFSAAMSIPGVDVSIPPGIFKIAQNLTPRCASIRGAGSIPLTGSLLKPTSAVTTLLSITSSGGNYPEYMGHFSIDGTAAPSGTGIVMGDQGGAVHADLANVEIGNFSGSGGIGLKVVDTIQTWVRHCYIFGCGTNLVVSGDSGFPTTTMFEQSEFDDATVAQGCLVQSGTDIVFNQCIFQSNAMEGFKASPGQSISCSNIVLNQCYFENNYNSNNYHFVADGSASGCILRVRLSEPQFQTSTATARAANCTGANCDVIMRSPVFATGLPNNIVYQNGAFGRIDQWDNWWSYPALVSDSAGKVIGWDGSLTNYSPTISVPAGSISGVSISLARWRRVGVHMLLVELNFSGTTTGSPNWLQASIPSGFTLQGTAVRVPCLVTDGGLEQPGACLTDGTTNLRLYKTNSVLFGAGDCGGSIQLLLEVL